MVAATFGDAMAHLGKLPPVAAQGMKMQSATNLVLRSHEAFSRSQYHLHQELEVAVPVERVWADLDATLAIYERMYDSDCLPFLLVEVRFSPAGHDRSLLGAGVDRASAWLCLCLNQSGRVGDYFDAIETWMRADGHEARTHLGKWCERLDATDLARMHGDRFEQFRRIRGWADPQGRFVNPFTERMFGPVGLVSVPGPPPRPRDDSFDQLGFRPMPATEWLAPRRYLRTTLQTALAEVAASFTDRRETLAALDPRSEPAPDLDRSRDEELWFDYVADTGDGFDHTYPVAWALAQDELAVEGCTEPLPAGRLLVLGGDQVYPVASDDSYRDRLVGVFGAALPWRDAGATRDAVAIPGNHDWYDGLGAFSRAFCQQRWLGAWQTHQHRSYFAVSLPHHWWLWGVDIALADLVDQTQLDYFDVLAARAAGDAAAAGTTARLVIVTAVPSWLDAVETAPREARIDRALDHFENVVAARHGIEVAAVIAGDKHFYARFEPEHGGGPTRIVSGGGGAFLHPTDHVPDRVSVAHPPERQLDDEPLRAGRAGADPHAIAAAPRAGAVVRLPQRRVRGGDGHRLPHLAGSGTGTRRRRGGNARRRDRPGPTTLVATGARLGHAPRRGPRRVHGVGGRGCR